MRGEEGGDEGVFGDAEDDDAGGIVFGVVGVREGLEGQSVPGSEVARGY